MGRPDLIRRNRTMRNTGRGLLCFRTTACFTYKKLYAHHVVKSLFNSSTDSSHRPTLLFLCSRGGLSLANWILS